MDVFGFCEARDAAVAIMMPGNVVINVVSLAALVVLKLNAWQARHYTAPRKDAYDLQFITTHTISTRAIANVYGQSSRHGQKPMTSITKSQALACSDTTRVRCSQNLVASVWRRYF